MIKEKTKEIEIPKVYYETEDGEFKRFDMSLPLQMLFDDVITFVSKTDF